MKKIALILACLIVAMLLAGCGGIDKRLYGKWEDESGSYGFGFGTDKKGYYIFQGFTLPILFDMKDDRLYVSFGEDVDPISDPDGITFSITFFGDNEFHIEDPPDSGNVQKFTRQTTTE